MCAVIISLRKWGTQKNNGDSTDTGCYNIEYLEKRIKELKRRKQILLVPLMVFCLAGCSAKTASDSRKPSETSPETETASSSETVQDTQPASEEAVSTENGYSVTGPAECEFFADLTHDGADDTIKVVVSKNKLDILQVMLSVSDGENVIFRLEESSHPVSGSMYSLVEQNGVAYLMRYYALVDHDLYHLDSFDINKWIDFAEKENKYFTDSFLLFNTLGFELECADTTDLKTYEENFSWMVTEGLEVWYSSRETTMKENLDLFLVEKTDEYDSE